MYRTSYTRFWVLVITTILLNVFRTEHDVAFKKYFAQVLLKLILNQILIVILWFLKFVVYSVLISYCIIDSQGLVNLYIVLLNGNGVKSLQESDIGVMLKDTCRLLGSLVV